MDWYRDSRSRTSRPQRSDRGVIQISSKYPCSMTTDRCYDPSRSSCRLLEFGNYFSCPPAAPEFDEPRNSFLPSRKDTIPAFALLLPSFAR